MNAIGRTRFWKQGPPRHFSGEQLEAKLEMKLQHEPVLPTQGRKKKKMLEKELPAIQA